MRPLAARLRALLRRRATRVVLAVAVLLGAAAGGLLAWNARSSADVRGSEAVEFVATDDPTADLEVQLPPSPAELAPPQPPPSVEAGLDPSPPVLPVSPVVPAVEPPPADPTVPAPTVADPDADPETPRPLPPVPAQATPAPVPAPLAWTSWGLSASRTRVVPPEIRLRPPFRRLWTFRAGSLVEFPPVVRDDRLYVGTNLGRVAAIDAATGEVVWEIETGRCIAASPALAADLLYVVLMDPSPCARHDETEPGFVLALDPETGEERWRFQAGVIETSPLLVDDLLVVGSWDRNVYGLDAATGDVRWTFATGGELKGGAAYRDGTVFIGSYDGRVYALDARSGRERWSAAGRGGLAGAGRYYATPALAYGRVFIGNVDGRVYALGASSGDLLWSRTTGGFVYSSAAVADETVFVGSYDERLYAFDAATGDTRWTFAAGAPISGSPAVLDGLVYFSTLEGRTFALDTQTGKRVWSFADGEYTPLVTDGRRVYLTGHGRIYGLEPRASRP